MTADLSARQQDTCILLFAKYPAPNKAKTRLQPALGVDGAARMARQLLLHSIEQAVDTGFAVELCVSPAPTDPCWQALDLPESLRWSTQANGDLGLRMLIASQQALQRFKKVVLIGADCPSLTTARIQTAVQQLNQHDTVMIPAADGGYVLLGFREIDDSLFSDIVWSTPSVAAVTKQRMAALDWTLTLFDPLHDIDEPKDLVHLPSSWLDSQLNIRVDND
ncbi:TIGR04282 family arsenosugar biosynthesis glycosyltransferase [Psychrobacter sp. 28M-43]|uniref:TIGR04282 family arsenosugar biosynthesis glycosyltransferase n=1 Tax=Psychrobacter sp. 28M-43 TaxID=2772254 RepID=UPI00168D6D23|nr:TIGR04282 family arsenosugar biosynthesis glycosyltransferase [Psychrobacter sp. 28M-43]QOD12012.1 TIGR04282 family arsenosugar biosynthesis glycosyltransferase [Psychrobacter sp. 28M-43]